MTKHCATCRHWGTEIVWTESADFGNARNGLPTPFYAIMRECQHPKPMMASNHCASPNHEGSPTTHPEFGCVQHEDATP